ncbi:MAG: thioredoxin domain-containing protein [Bacteroidota bacterium]
MSTQEKTPNRLIHETSPYLLQHAYNPVEWYPWGKEALEKAKTEDKPIILSIGYSSCHWCHVMERESFENESIAKIMNDQYICIKLDREERPDIDQIYMEAVQAMGINGGWPLNVILTPDQKPFYGGTYFPPRGWANLLNQVSKAFKEKRDDLEDSANQFQKSISIKESDRYKLEGNHDFSEKVLKTSFEAFSRNFDAKFGGLDKAPKFPMPSNWELALEFSRYFEDDKALQHLNLTLEKMALGGIYDQAGGGFSRYSVDGEWFAPHFEKMLYDNAQLVNLYAKAYSVTRNDLYRAVVLDTISFLEREMLNESGGFYTALDADSEGVEGKFYTWTYEELNKVLKEEDQWILDFYAVTEDGNWEDGRNILKRDQSNKEFAQEKAIDLNNLESDLVRINQSLLKERSKRIRPGLDDKIISGWNGLLLRGLCTAYKTFNEPSILELAEKNAQFLEREMIENNHLLRSYKDGKATISGFLEDYAAVIDGLNALYEVTFDEHWIILSKGLMETCIIEFFDHDDRLFYYTSSDGESLIARKKEIFDNVIPASNSIMAGNLLFLGVVFDREDWKEMSKEMVSKIGKFISRELAYTSNWALQYLKHLKPTCELVLVGENADQLRGEIQSNLLLNTVTMGTMQKSDLPHFEGRTQVGNETFAYVCFNKSCQLPVKNSSDALKLIQQAG